MRKEELSNKELLELLKNEYYRVKPKGCFDFMRKRDKRIPCLPILQKRFNGKTFNQILIDAGVSDDDLNFVRRSKEQYLKKIQEITDAIGYVPNQKTLIELGHSPSVVINLCGSWENALKELGYDSNDKSKAKVKETKEELLQQYIKFSNRLGRPATYGDLDSSDEVYNAQVYVIRFGGLNNLRVKAGLDTIDRFNSKYTKEGILNKLIAKRLTINRRLTTTDIRNDKELPNLVTILRYFKTTKISEVIEKVEGIVISINNHK